MQFGDNPVGTMGMDQQERFHGIRMDVGQPVQFGGRHNNPGRLGSAWLRVTTYPVSSVTCPER